MSDKKEVVILTFFDADLNNGMTLSALIVAKKLLSYLGYMEYPPWDPEEFQAP